MTRLCVVRAVDGVDREVLIKDLCARTPSAAIWVTESDGRPPIAVVRGARVDAPLAHYDVDATVQWDDAITGMEYSMFAFFRSSDGLDREEFLGRYRAHAPVARLQHPGIRRYVQDVVTDQSGPDRWMCSAISELHFAGRDEYRDRFWATDASPDVVARDVARFSDRATAKSIVAPRVQ